MIKPTLHKRQFDYKFKGEDDWGNKREYDGFIIKESSGKRLYLTGLRDGMKMNEIKKNMKFDEGKIYLMFGKDKVEIGDYEEV